jgi:hypothetical protein
MRLVWEPIDPMATLVRKEKETGIIEKRNRGRKNSAFEYGYLNKDGEFVPGDPPQDTQNAYSEDERQRARAQNIETRLQQLKEVTFQVFNDTLNV